MRPALKGLSGCVLALRSACGGTRRCQLPGAETERPPREPLASRQLPLVPLPPASASAAELNLDIRGQDATSTVLEGTVPEVSTLPRSGTQGAGC